MAKSKRRQIQERAMVLLNQLRNSGKVAAVTRRFAETLDLDDIPKTRRPQLYVFFGETPEEGIGMYGGTGDDTVATLRTILTVQGSGKDIHDELSDVARDARAKLIADATLRNLLVDIEPGGENPEDGMDADEGMVEVSLDMMYSYNMETGG